MNPIVFGLDFWCFDVHSLTDLQELIDQHYVHLKIVEFARDDLYKADVKNIYFGNNNREPLPAEFQTLAVQLSHIRRGSSESWNQTVRVHGLIPKFEPRTELGRRLLAKKNEHCLDSVGRNIARELAGDIGQLTYDKFSNDSVDNRRWIFNALSLNEFVAKINPKLYSDSVEQLLRTENPVRKEFTVEEALRIADVNASASKQVASVSRTLAAEVRRLRSELQRKDEGGD